MKDDPKSITDVLAYVTEIYREMAQENAAPTLGTQNQMVEFVLADGELLRAAQDWARRANPGEAGLEPLERPARDAAFCRVRERLLETMELPSKFGTAPRADKR